jgi:hypothetical protein
MATIDYVPIELVQDIVECIHCSSESSRNLFSVLLLSKSFHLVAADILSRAPRLSEAKPDFPYSWNLGRQHQVRGFLHNILNKPQLAAKVRDLDLSIIANRVRVQYERNLDDYDVNTQQLDQS